MATMRLMKRRVLLSWTVSLLNARCRCSRHRFLVRPRASRVKGAKHKRKELPRYLIAVQNRRDNNNNGDVNIFFCLEVSICACTWLRQVSTNAPIHIVVKRTETDRI